MRAADAISEASDASEANFLPSEVREGASDNDDNGLREESEGHESEEVEGDADDLGPPPEEPTDIGCPSADYFGDGLPREGLEPPTVAPGRWLTATLDVWKLLQDFEQLLTEVRMRVGGFPLLRQLYRGSAASILLEPVVGENRRDLFQFICGVCWHHFMHFEGLTSKAGVIFLIYLLFHSQRLPRSAVPVSVNLLQHLNLVKGQCIAEDVFLECPAIIREMVRHDTFSVGLRAGCRNMFFDFHGQLVERQVGNQQMLGANPETALKIRDDKAFIEIEEAPAVADLQSQITHYEDGGGRGQIDPSLSQQVDLVADASKAFEGSMPSEPLPELEAGNEPKKRRRTRRPRRVISDEETNEEPLPAESISQVGVRHELVDGQPRDAWRRPWMQSCVRELRGLEPVDAAGGDRLLAVVERSINTAEAHATLSPQVPVPVPLPDSPSGREDKEAPAIVDTEERPDIQPEDMEIDSPCPD